MRFDAHVILAIFMYFGASAEAGVGPEISIHGKVTKMSQENVVIQHDGMLFNVKRVQISDTGKPLRLGSEVFAAISREQLEVAKLNSRDKKKPNQ